VTGAVSYHGGRVAENQVAAHYQRLGMTIAASRWRGQSGEIDLIVRSGATVIFIEVKRAENFAIAAERLSQRQMARIYGAASEYVANEPLGQNTEMRFDVALVDGAGRIEIIDNAASY
jgi:putative endonuclease